MGLTMDAKKARTSLGKLFDPEGPGYDMETALAAGMKANAKGKWGSRDARTGLLLKGRKHISWPDTVAGEKEAGYRIFKKKDGRYYSEKLRGNK